ncbi:Dipeptide transport system permease protein DppB [Vibrio aerogenes CECT 7868]|uniref:Dipeptide transport system permease protein DppB n=1 Tax=Vibrio aerogenes CECT 7868 TaxID=1216006 RepID=A0A1M5YR33_9VIBR|nr:ABC transporter permease [Vibrio aerogenes]SHI14431.1 Dipeptide transport system permease protein DppB [Vibrio aerogenes CECT 7868]
MLRFIFRRLIQAAGVLLTITLVSFLVQGQLGDPVQQMLGQNVSLETRMQLKAELGLDQPLLVQYQHFLSRAIHGDLGTSYYYKEPTLNVIFSKLPATVELSVCALILVALVATPLGVIAAIRPRHFFARTIMFFSTLGLSVPIFIFGILLVWLLSVELRWLPSFGRGDTVELFGFWQSGMMTVDGLKHLILPAVSIAFVLIPMFIRLICAEMTDVLHSDYIRFARSKGLSSVRIYFIHALKNTMLPVITIGGIQVGTLVAYTIVTETIFQWPGMGRLFMEAITRVDTPLIAAYLIVVGCGFVLLNTLVDLIYGLVNPRVRIPGYGV